MSAQSIGRQASPWLEPPPFLEIQEATERLRGSLVETPLLENERLNDRVGGRVFVKAESLQRTGSFKARGAWNWLSLIDPREAKAGLVALSSGNHGQAVAWAAKCLGIGPVMVLMPMGTPKTKIERTKAWGSSIIFFDPMIDRAAMIKHWVQDMGRAFVPAYDDRRIIAGAGTVGLEATRQAAQLGAQPDLMIVACSGGGLSAGCAVALADVKSKVSLLAVEPEGYDDTARSLAVGKRLSVASRRQSICDALLAPMPGELTFAVNFRLGTKALAVPECYVRSAMAILFTEFGLVVEPGGALPLAAVLADPSLARGRTVVIVASGANVDASLFCEIILRQHEIK